MVQAKKHRRVYTRGEFLEWESRQDERWEFIVGRIKMMAGGSADHNLIAGNIFAVLHAALRGSPCRPFQQNMKLAPESNDDVTYPDVLVICRPFDGKAQTLASATVIVEVLSKSSRDDDYGDKWEGYQAIPDLRHYLIVSQDEPMVLVYTRTGEEEDWRFRRVEGLDAGVDLAALGVTLSLRDVFEGTTVARGG